MADEVVVNLSHDGIDHLHPYHREPPFPETEQRNVQLTRLELVDHPRRDSQSNSLTQPCDCSFPL